MNFLETLRSAIQNIFSNKMRTLLTTLGIIIGISSVIIITGLGSGIQKAMNDQFEQMGVSTLQIMIGGGRDTKITTKDLLTLKDLEIVRKCEDVKYVSSAYQGRGQAEIKLLDPTKTKNANLAGITPDYYYINGSKLIKGRYVSEADLTARSKVAVINDTTAQKIFGHQDVIGEKLQLKTRLGTQKYTVIGLLKNATAEMETMYGDNYPELVVVPITTLMGMYGEKYIDGFLVNVVDKNQMTAASEKIIKLLEDAHGNAGKNMYYVYNPSDMLDTINTTLSMFTLFIGFVAGISLLVGGIGVMNIMMVTVTERTREIGIRKSIGARNSDIRIQFIVEAIILTSIGGLIGIALGYLGGQGVAGLIPKEAFGFAVTAVISPSAVLLAFGISSFIGIVFGVYPANKAAKLDPIDALRYE